MFVESQGSETSGVAASAERHAERPEFFAGAADKLSFLERANVRFIRMTFEIPVVDRLLTWCLRVIGAGWVHHCTKHIRSVYGLERLPAYAASSGFIVVSNHRSFFDLYVVQMALYRAGWKNRVLFPVRSNFFYDNPLGFLVNGIMSFWSMYPPIFRDRKKAMLNHIAFNELVWATRDGRAAGIHPEGTRKKDDDPYTLFPAQSGVGRIIHQARIPVIPVFINGLGNDLPKQVLGNFTRKGRRVMVVFGAPINFGETLDLPATARSYKLIADQTLDVIRSLGQEEKALRAQHFPDVA